MQISQYGMFVYYYFKSDVNHILFIKVSNICSCVYSTIYWHCNFCVFVYLWIYGILFTILLVLYNQNMNVLLCGERPRCVVFNGMKMMNWNFIFQMYWLEDDFLWWWWLFFFSKQHFTVDAICICITK